MPKSTTWRDPGFEHYGAARPILFAAILGLAACAAQEPVAPADDGAGLVYDANDLRANAASVAIAPLQPNNDELVCRKETRSGSHFSRKRCVTREQAEHVRKNAQLWLRTGGKQGGGVVAR
jgi:hypothetical protein